MHRIFVTLALAATTAFAADLRLELRPIITGLSQPLGIRHAGDGRLFIVEQGGRILVYNGTSVLPTPFLDIRSGVSCCGEQGLLGLAFHPNYASNGFFYVNYTDLGGDTVVARYRVSATDPNRADAGSASLILHVSQPFANHNGGNLLFGPDGYLYIGMGDGGSGGDPGNRAQNLNELLGKMLRIDVNGAAPYAIPPTNPFANSTNARREIWAYGLRNPWRFSFDRENGDLWIGDVGQNAWEEVDLQRASSNGGENYGWRRMEGTHCFNPSTNCAAGSTLVLPVLEYSHADDNCSVTGGYRYRGTKYPRLRGMYLYADFCTGKIWGATETGSTWTTRLLLDVTFPISTFGEDVNGELYLSDHGNGRVLAIVDAEPIGPKRRIASK